MSTQQLATSSSRPRPANDSEQLRERRQRRPLSQLDLAGDAENSARQAIDLVLKAHEPNPALAVDRHWNLVSANRMVAPLLAGLPSALLEAQPLNVLRL